MPSSSKLKIGPRRRNYVRLIGNVRHVLSQALVEEGLTKSQVAVTLNTNPSFVTRKLAGTSNMTLETLADLAYAMNRSVEITLPKKKAAQSGANDAISSPCTRTSDPATPEPNPLLRIVSM